MRYLISYDLNKQGQAYPALTKQLTELGAVKVLFSEWLLVASSSTSDIYTAIKTTMDDNDSLLVVALTGEATWTSGKLKSTDDTVKRILNS